MKFKKLSKAQGALEYLLIIGAAILVVAVVIVALTGVLGTGKDNANTEPTDSAYTGLREIIDLGKNQTILQLRLLSGENTLNFSSINQNNTIWGVFGTTTSGEEIINETIIIFNEVDAIKEDGAFFQGETNVNSTIIPINTEITIIIPNGANEQIIEVIVNEGDNVVINNNPDYYDNVGANISNPNFSNEPSQIQNDGSTNSPDTCPENVTLQTYTIFSSETPRTPISSCDDLLNIDNNFKGNYYLTNNIDCSGKTNFPIKFTAGFSGVLDGNNFKISNVTINSTQSYTGLFNKLNSALIQRLVLENIQINSTAAYTGSIAGSSSKSIIVSSLATGVINGKSFTGGLIGTSSSDNIYFSSTNLVIDGNEVVGGLVGENKDGNIIESKNSGVINGTRMLGGIAGKNTNGQILNSFSATEINGKTDLGGLIGINTGKIEFSHSLGKVFGTGISINGEILTNPQIGGLIGGNSTSGIVNNSYWNTTTSMQQTSIRGTGLNDTEMKIKSNFQNWDFSNTWCINQNNYPNLRN